MEKQGKIFNFLINKAVYTRASVAYGWAFPVARVLNVNFHLLHVLGRFCLVCGGAPFVLASSSER